MIQKCVHCWFKIVEKKIVQRFLQKYGPVNSGQRLYPQPDSDTTDTGIVVQLTPSVIPVHGAPMILKLT